MVVTVFRSRLSPGAQEEYGPLAGRVSELTRTMPGCIYAGSACGRSTSDASSRDDGSLIVTTELIDVHRRLAHDMRNAALRAAVMRIMRGLRRFFCDRRAGHRRPATDAGKCAARER